MALTWEAWWGFGPERLEKMLTSMTLDDLEYYLRHPPGQQAGLWSFIRAGGSDARSQQILAKLEDPVSMSFAYETPLEDVLKYIKQATTTASYSGIQIYVDPVALQDAEKTMTSTVKMDLEGVPLKTTLRLLLNQLGLDYVVEDGMLRIGSASTLSNSGSFHRIGHCYWALLAAFCGGFAGRVLYDRSQRPAEARRGHDQG
jgi:hypothetical protein